MSRLVYPVSRRDFLKATGGVAALGALGTLPGSALSSSWVVGERRPNLLFVFTDQQSHDMLGAYNNPQIITPNLDDFAQRSIRFEHCVSSCPVCTPMRGILLSGQHPLHNGAFVNDAQLLPNNGTTFGEALRDNGYRTGYIGKWHLYGGNRNRAIPPGPHRHGFDDVFLSNNSHLDYRPGHCFYFDENGEKVFFDEWEAYGQTDQAIDFLDQQSEEDPFALFLSWHPPHDHLGGRQYLTEAELEALYDPEKIELRPNVIDTPLVRHWYHGYMAMCSGIDIAFGRLMKKLEQKGLADNTIIVFTSDHGDHLNSNRRPWPKSFPEDASVRVPFLLRLPKDLRGGSSSELLVSTFDLMPSLLGMMGISPPDTCQGRDLSKDIAQGREDTVDSVPILMTHPGWRGVYTRDFTYAYDERAEQRDISFNVLYNREADPWQMDNLYYEASAREIRERLHQETLSHMERFDDRFWTGEQIHEACGLSVQLSRQEDGACPCRPIDLLHDLGKPGFFAIALPTPEEDVVRGELAEQRASRWDIMERRSVLYADPSVTEVPVFDFEGDVLDANTHGFTEGYSEHAMAEGEQLAIRTWANHPHPRPILWVPLEFETDRFSRAELRVRVAPLAGVEKVSCSLVVRHSGWTGEDIAFDIPADGQWQTLTFDLNESSSWARWSRQGRFGLMLPTPPPISGESLEITLDYLNLKA